MLSIATVTGFCDYEVTIDRVFGTYTWPESRGGQSVSLPCLTSDELATRACLGFEQRWSPLIDFTKCRNSKLQL